MIEPDTLCYLFKSTKDGTKRIYHRISPDYTMEGDERWNTPHKDSAGQFTKRQWQLRAAKWTFNAGWMLESATEVEALVC